MIIKSDSGPGRDNNGYKFLSHVEGVSHYPGLPNGTLFQEMDQVFGLLKTRMDNSRRDIFNQRFQLDGQSARVGLADIPEILFGGDVISRDGQHVLHLPNNFEQCLDAEHMESAIRKCGYVPATRIALESGKLRQELDIIYDESREETSEDRTSCRRLLLSIEKQNHEMVEDLVEKGYKLAGTLKRTLKRNSSFANTTTSTTVTRPGTTARQRALMKASTAGTFYRVTDGGGPTNCTDCLLAAEMKQFEKEGKILEKAKESVMEMRGVQEVALAVVAGSGDDPSKWKVPQLRAMILSKEPELKTTLQAWRRPKLLEEWTNQYKYMPSSNPTQRWTKRDEKNLQRIKNNDIGAIEKTGIYRRALQDRTDFLHQKVENIDKKGALKLALKALQLYFDSPSDAADYVSSNFDDDGIYHHDSDSSDEEEDLDESYMYLNISAAEEFIMVGNNEDNGNNDNNDNDDDNDDNNSSTDSDNAYFGHISTDNDNDGITNHDTNNDIFLDTQDDEEENEVPNSSHDDSADDNHNTNTNDENKENHNQPMVSLCDLKQMTFRQLQSKCKENKLKARCSKDELFKNLVVFYQLEDV